MYLDKVASTYDLPPPQCGRHRWKHPDRDLTMHALNWTILSRVGSSRGVEDEKRVGPRVEMEG